MVRPGLVLGVAALLVAVGIGGLEVFWRVRDVAPSVLDSKRLWSSVRGDVYGRNKVVLIGGSRILFNVVSESFSDFDPVLETRYLGLGATFGVAALRDLAHDRDFDGRVIASMRAEGLEPARWDSQQDYVDYYHREWRMEKQLSQSLQTGLAQNLAVLNPAVGLRRLLEKRVDDGVLPRFWLAFRGDRSIAADFTRRSVDASTLAAIVKKHYETSLIMRPAQWLETTEPVEGWIRAIQACGGRVAFVRFPTAKKYWKYDERFYPREQYWDRFAARSSAVSLHFRDVPALNEFELPDMSHLNHWDAPAFTTALIEALAAEDFFAGQERRHPGKAR